MEEKVQFIGFEEELVNVDLLSTGNRSAFHAFFLRNLGSNVICGIPEGEDNISPEAYAILKEMSSVAIRFNCEDEGGGHFQGYAGVLGGYRYIIGAWDFPMSAGMFGLYMRQEDKKFWEDIFSVVPYVFTDKV